MSKVFETLLASQINEFCEKCAILCDNQFGFYTKSIPLNCAKYNDWWLKASPRFPQGCKSSFSWFEKGLWHCWSLTFHGQTWPLWVLGISYCRYKGLSSRSLFMVWVADQRSDKVRINLGVYQGSILGPFIFILFINYHDFLEVSSTIILFTDETPVHPFGESIASIAHNITMISNFVYCSSLFISINQTSFIQLEKWFAKSLKQILNIRISRLNIYDQLSLLQPFKILLNNYVFQLHLYLPSYQKYPSQELTLPKIFFLLHFNKNSFSSFLDINILNLFEKIFYYRKNTNFIVNFFYHLGFFPYSDLGLLSVLLSGLYKHWDLQHMSAIYIFFLTKTYFFVFFFMKKCFKIKKNKNKLFFSIRMLKHFSFA